MRCYCCGRALNDYESTLRSKESNEFLDMCMKCLDGLDIETVGRDDLSMYDDSEEEFEDDDPDNY